MSDRMASCGDCGREISRKAVMCPGCGRAFGGQPPLEVGVSVVSMSISDLAWFLVRLAIALIPAAVVLAALAAAVMVVIQQVFR